MHNLGLTLASWRHLRGLTQAELANMAHIPRPNLSAIERGRKDIYLSTLEKLANALGTDPALLLDTKPIVTIGVSDRHRLDELARAMVDGTRSFDTTTNYFLDQLASLLTQRLRAHQVPGYKRVQRRFFLSGQDRLIIYRLYGKEAVNRVLKRVEKYL